MKGDIRQINLEGSFNCRDLGGYPTTEGYSVKKGQLFRAGNLSQLTENDLEIVYQLGIKNILDLRDSDEIERHPTPTLTSVSRKHIPLIADGTLVRQAGDLKDKNHSLENMKPEEMLVFLNEVLVSNTRAFRKIFEVLLSEPEAPLLFHCMAGKDRTGAVAALILSVLGVPRDIIVEDYLYTNRSLDQMKEHFRELDYHRHPSVDQGMLNAMFEARIEYINAFFAELEKKYENVDVYLKEAIGLTDDDIHVLKKHLLE